MHRWTMAQVKPTNILLSIKTIRMLPDYGLNDAIAFAAEVYDDKMILDTEVPFILQAMGTASLLGDLGCSPYLIVSGLLAPAVADKLLNLKEVKEKFGLRVAQLLSAYVEDKTVPWFIRKLEYLNDVFKTDDIEAELLALAVAISELRSIYRVYKDDETVIYILDVPCEAVAMYYKEAVKRMAVFAAEKIRSTPSENWRIYTPKYFCCKPRTRNRSNTAFLTFVLILQAATGSFLQVFYLLNNFHSPYPNSRIRVGRFSSFHATI